MDETTLATTIVAFALVCAILCAFIGRAKHRPIFPFVFMGLLFGVFGLIYALFAKRWPRDDVTDAPAAGWYESSENPSVETFWTGERWGPSRPKP